MAALATAEVIRHIGEAEEVYVSTLNAEGYPLTRVMFNLHHAGRFPKQAAFLSGLDEGLCIYFATNACSAKVAHLARSPKMSVYYHPRDSWRGMLVAGNAEIVSDMAVKRGLWQEEWSVYYQGGVEGEDFTIVRLRPVLAEYYHDMTKETLSFVENEHADRA